MHNQCLDLIKVSRFLFLNHILMAGLGLKSGVFPDLGHQNVIFCTQSHLIIIFALWPGPSSCCKMHSSCLLDLVPNDNFHTSLRAEKYCCVVHLLISEMSLCHLARGQLTPLLMSFISLIV